jgi:hypothetical protein
MNQSSNSHDLFEAFSAPFNWCDRVCERCPLANECPLWKREQQSRWVHAARGEDPDDLAVVMNDVVEIFEKLAKDLEASARERGIDLDAPLPPRPLVLDAARLRKAGQELVVAASESSEPNLVRCAMTLAMKAGRVAGYLEDAVNPAWDADAVPNLLLIDRLRADVAVGLANLGASRDQRSAAQQRAERALADLDAVLGPLIDSVGETPKALIAMLSAKGMAPSPFCGAERVVPTSGMGPKRR